VKAVVIIILIGILLLAALAAIPRMPRDLDEDVPVPWEDDEPPEAE